MNLYVDARSPFRPSLFPPFGSKGFPFKSFWMAADGTAQGIFMAPGDYQYDRRLSRPMTLTRDSQPALGVLSGPAIIRRGPGANDPSGQIECYSEFDLSNGPDNGQDGPSYGTQTVPNDEGIGDLLGTILTSGDQEGSITDLGISNDDVKALRFIYVSAGTVLELYDKSGHGHDRGLLRHHRKNECDVLHCPRVGTKLRGRFYPGDLL